MDAWELTEDMLDAIAAERDASLKSRQEALDKIERALASGDAIEAGHLSAEAERHSEAVCALNRALRRCQRIKDEAVEAAEAMEEISE